MLPREQITKAKRSLAAVSLAPAVAFEALGDETRFRIFLFLMDHSGVCVSDVAHALSITLPAASQQLKVMERSGIITRMRKGQMVCYEINTSSPIAMRITRLLRHYYSSL